MLLAVYFVFLLVEILLFFPEEGTAATAFTSKPLKPSYVKEGQDITLMWIYTLDGTVGAADFVNFTVGDANDVIGKIFGNTGNLNIEAKYNGRFQAQVSNTQAQLKILRVQTSDQGIYRFRVNPTGAGELEDGVQVIVQSPPKFTNLSQNQTVNEGTNLQLNCEASGKPTPNITWTRVFKDGSNSEVLHRGPTWNFPNINGSNAGTYNCTADNGAGIPVSHTVTVIVKFSPQITLNKQDYIDRGENADLHCQVEAYPLPIILWVPCNPQESVCDSSFLNISNVQTPRTNYTCTATNERGQASATTTLVIGGTKVYISMTIITNEKCTEGASWREQIIEEMKKVFANSIVYSSAKVLNCRLGSVIVDLGLTFSVPVAEDFVISSIQSVIQDGKLGELTVNASSIIGIPPVVTSTSATPTSPTSPGSGENKTLIIVLSVVGGILFLVLVAVVVACCIRMQNRKDSREVDDHTSPKDGGQPSGPAPGAPGQNNTSYEDAGYANTSAARTKKGEKGGKKPSKKQDAQVEETPMYAQVDKSKKKPKPNTYSEADRPDRREPGEIQYTTVDHSNPRGSIPRGAATQPRRGPETVYADLV